MAWLVLLAAGLGLPAAQAADTGWKTATVAPVGGGTWGATFTTANLGTSDNAYAISTGATVGQLSTFGFGVPAGAKIGAIEVEVEGSQSVAGTVTYQLDLSWNTGTTWTTWTPSGVGPTPESFTGTTDTTTVLGAGNLWGHAWIDTELSDANFRLRIARTGGAGNLRVDRIRVRVSYYTLPWPAGTMQVRSGSYVGDGTNGRTITGLGFQPDVVIVTSDESWPLAGGRQTLVRTSTMGAGDVSQSAYGLNETPLLNRIQSLDADGFTVGEPPTHAPPNDSNGVGTPYHCANHNGVRFYWTAFKAAAGELELGTYVGDNTSPRDITTLSFRPDYVLTMSPEGGGRILQHSSAMPVGFSYDLDGGSYCAAGCNFSPEIGISDMLANGFRIGGGHANSLLTTFHYVAWKAAAGRMAVGQYTGNGADNRSLTGVGFRPEFVSVTLGGTASNSTPMKMGAMGPGSDRSYDYVYYGIGFSPLDMIQALEVNGFQVGTSAQVNGNGNTYNWVAFGPGTGPMQVLSGAYAGDGVDNRAIPVGFRPDVVFIKRDTGTGSFDYYGVITTSSLTANKTKPFDDFPAAAVFAGGVKSLTATGFTLGTTAPVNQAGFPYYWIAFQAGAGEMKVGTYQGNGIDPHAVTGIGFRPDYVVVFQEGASTVVQSSSSMSADESYNFDALRSTDRIQQFLPDGFEVGGDAEVNTNLVTYHYIAWKAVPGRMAVGKYVGTGVDNKTWNVTGFMPEWVMVKRADSAAGWVHKPASTGVTADYSLFFADYTGQSNDIQKLLAAGFEVGFGGEVNDRTNQLGTTYHYVAFGPHAATPIYYSVGTSGAVLYSANASAAMGTLTLASAAANNVGVGDEVRLVGTPAARYYISGRTSSTVFTIQDSAANGGTPGASNLTFASQAITIRRAYNSLTAAEAGSSDASHLNTANLVTGNYQLNWPCYKDAPMNDQVTISGYTTAVGNFIRVYTPVYMNQVGASQRHTGTARTGFRLQPTGAVDKDSIVVLDSFVRVEGIEIDGSLSTAPNGAGGVFINTLGTTPVDHYVSHDIIYETRNFTGICVRSMSAKVWNNDVFRSNELTLGAVSMDQPGGTGYFYNNTVYDHAGHGINANAGTMVATNNVSMKPGGGFFDYKVGTGTLTQSHNVSSDATAAGTGSKTLKNAYATYFVNTTLGSEDLHLKADSGTAPMFGGYGTPLHLDSNQAVGNDIDSGPRDAVNPDMGADEYLATTAVKLASFTARGFDAAVLLEWETASELDNLGFHVYRSASPNGPWQRLTGALIPGLGSSPEGKRYSWADRGLTNGASYYYRLEDLDRSGLATSHGPVSAVPVAGQALPKPEAPIDPEKAPASKTGAVWQTHGNPADVSLRVLQKSARGAMLELRTGGFYSQVQADGSVRLAVPGFFDTAEPGLPAVPVKRAWIDAVVGRGARVVGAQAFDMQYFQRLTPWNAGEPEAQARTDGTFRAASRRVRAKDPGGLYPRAAASVLETAFQDEIKRAYLELAPLRFGGRRLVLAGRLVVKVAFEGRVEGEQGSGGARGRRQPAAPRGDEGTLVARLAARVAGLHAVSWESLAASPALQQRGGQALSTSGLRLSRLGRLVAFHVEPRADRFGPGSTLYFLAEGPETAYGTETVYELALAAGGVQMPLGRVARPSGASLVPALVATRSFEQNTNYLPGLLAARDLWLWDIGLLAPNGRDYPFTLSAPSAGSGPALLAVDLQGGSDAPKLDPDHDVRVLVNGVPVGEARWDGLNPSRFEASVDASILAEGTNTLRIEDLDTTGAFDSVVYLDRFSLQYARRLEAESGRLAGRAPTSGVVRAAGFPTGALLVDVSGPAPVWLTASAAGGEIAFAAEAQKSYLAVSPEAVLRPEVRAVSAPSLRAASLQVDWIVIAPQELLGAAEPLVAARASQGLRAMAVSLEQVQDEFGYGERSPQMIREFLAYAYHHWTAPSLRYVLLLGDASSDPKGYLPTAARKNLLPTPLVKSTYLWTASDPSLAAVNGDDAIPDLAIGRLTAGSLAEAEAAVQKILDFEASGQTLDGNAVLVADNPDIAGDFEANANDIASLLPGRPVERIFLTQYGAGTRAAVLNAFDAGASLVSYVGHGSQAIWASEGILRSIDVALLAPQPRQPLLLTMTCSNGYFISPFLNGIAERFVLERDKGAIAAFSPSGLSLDEAAHLFHRALVQHLQSGRHERLGDLVLAAQKDYADTGAFPELLSIYHLFADPALKLR